MQWGSGRNHCAEGTARFVFSSPYQGPAAMKNVFVRSLIFTILLSGSSEAPRTQAVIEPDYAQEDIPPQGAEDDLGAISSGRLALCFEIPTVLTALSIAVGTLIHQRRSQARD